VPDEYIEKVCRVMLAANWHACQVLTKRADRMAALLQDKLRRVEVHFWLKFFALFVLFSSLHYVSARQVRPMKKIWVPHLHRPNRSAMRDGTPNIPTRN